MDHTAKILRVHVFMLTEIPLIPFVCLLSMFIYPSVWPVISPSLAWMELHSQKYVDTRALKLTQETFNFKTLII